MLCTLYFLRSCTCRLDYHSANSRIVAASPSSLFGFFFGLSSVLTHTHTQTHPTGLTYLHTSAARRAAVTPQTMLMALPVDCLNLDTRSACLICCPRHVRIKYPDTTPLPPNLARGAGRLPQRRDNSVTCAGDVVPSRLDERSLARRARGTGYTPSRPLRRDLVDDVRASKTTRPSLRNHACSHSPVA